MLHTNHPKHGDNGKYLFFDANDFTKMVSETDWHDKTYEIIQRGSKSWTGTIKVWNGKKHGVHGWRASGESAGDWAQGDMIQLKSCVEAGI